MRGLISLGCQPPALPPPATLLRCDGFPAAPRPQAPAAPPALLLLLPAVPFLPPNYLGDGRGPTQPENSPLHLQPSPFRASALVIPTTSPSQRGAGEQAASFYSSRSHAAVPRLQERALINVTLLNTAGLGDQHLPFALLQ